MINALEAQRISKKGLENRIRKDCEIVNNWLIENHFEEDIRETAEQGCSLIEKSVERCPNLEILWNILTEAGYKIKYNPMTHKVIIGWFIEK